MRFSTPVSFNVRESPLDFHLIGITFVAVQNAVHSTKRKYGRNLWTAALLTTLLKCNDHVGKRSRLDQLKVFWASLHVLFALLTVMYNHQQRPYIVLFGTSTLPNRDKCITVSLCPSPNNSSFLMVGGFSKTSIFNHKEAPLQSPSLLLGGA